MYVGMYGAPPLCGGMGLIRVVIEYNGRVALMRFVDNVKLSCGQVISKAGNVCVV